MRYLPVRRHVPHWEHPCGTVALTWLLHRDQPVLRDDERTIVLEVISRGADVVGQILAAVVMDDHVHAVVSLAKGWTGVRAAQTWKSVSAHALTRDFGRSAPVWQRAYFDRWMMDRERVERCVAYVLGNPTRRWPGRTDYPWLIGRGIAR